MNKKILIYILIGAILLLTIVGAVIYKMLPLTDNKTDASEQREDGLLLEGDILNAGEAKEEVVIVDGDPVQEIEYAGEDPDEVQDRTKYYDENGKEVLPIVVKGEQPDVSLDFETFSKDSSVVEVSDTVKVAQENNGNCNLAYNAIYTSDSKLTSLPKLDSCGDNLYGIGDSGKAGNKVLCIFGTDALIEIDLSGEDLSKYDSVEIYNCNNLQKLNIGNYVNKLADEGGWALPLTLLYGSDVSNLKEVRTSNVNMAKWIKTGVPSDCDIYVNGEKVSLDYIIVEK